MQASVVVTDCWLQPGLCLLSRLGRVAAGDGCLLSLDSQLPLVAGQIGGGGHQRIYGSDRACHELDIPGPNKQQGLAQYSGSRPRNMTGDSSVACITTLRQSKACAVLH